MLNLLRRILRPTLREQLEEGVREALRRYTERHTAPSLRVFVSTDLVPEGMDPPLWAADEAEHLRRFALQWAEDNDVPRAGLRLEVVLLDTKREFAFVKPLGLEPRAEEPRVEPGVAPPPSGNAEAAPAPAEPRTATLEVLGTATFPGPVVVREEATLGRKAEDGVLGTGDRYMSARHARFHLAGGYLWITDLDSKNRTFLNDHPLPPHQQAKAEVGDVIRMGTTTLRVSGLG